MTANPGSDEAVAQGCICAVMDNNRGKFPPWQGGYWVTGGCPVHAPASPVAADPVAAEVPGQLPFEETAP